MTVPIIIRYAAHCKTDRDLGALLTVRLPNHSLEGPEPSSCRYASPPILIHGRGRTDGATVDFLPPLPGLALLRLAITLNTFPEINAFARIPLSIPSEAHKIPVLYVSSTRPMFQNILIPYRVRLMSKQSFRALPPNPGLVICRALFGRKPSAELFSCRNALRGCVRPLTVREFRFAVSEVVVVVSIVIYVHCPPC